MIILIDDNRIDLKVHKTIIERSGVKKEIVAFEHPTKALEWLNQIEGEKLKKSLILLDINMPIINGFELIELLSETRQEVLNSAVFYLLTSSNDRNDVQKAASYPCISGLIQKPLTLPKLSQLEKYLA